MRHFYCSIISRVSSFDDWTQAIRANLIIDPEHVYDVYPDVDDVNCVGEREVELVVVAGQAEVLAGGELSGAGHLLPWPSRHPPIAHPQSLHTQQSVSNTKGFGLHKKFKC